MVVHARLPTFHIEGSADIRTWLFTICLNIVRNYRRRAVHRREVSTDVVPEHSQSPTQEEHIDQSRAALRLARLLGALDENKRIVFVMHDLEGIEMREIVDTLGVPLQTGYSRLRAARQRLEEAIAQERAHEEAHGL